MKIAVITGASSGLGEEFVYQIDRLYQNLDEIWVIARREDRLRKLNTKAALRVFCGDISREDFYQKFIESLEFIKPDIRILVNAAGFGKVGRVSHITKEDKHLQSRMIQVNCIALTRLTCECLDYLKRGARIINIASAAAFCPQCDLSVYAATKSYVLSFSRSLHQELKERQISVTAVCPGPVKTEFFEIAGNAGNLTKQAIMAEKEKVVSQALKDAIRRKTVSVYGVPMKAARIFAKLCPQDISIRLMEKLSKIH